MLFELVKHFQTVICNKEEWYIQTKSHSSYNSTYDILTMANGK